jgi:glycosyltransferase involved in cell wall biosynthesis
MTCERIVKGFGNKVSCIITPSEAKAKVLRDYGVTNRIEVIPNYLDLKKYTDVSDAQIEELRKELELENKKILLYVGRVASEKNLDFLLESFEIVNKDDKDTVLLVVGDGPELLRIKEKADEMGMRDKVKFTGNVDYNKLPVFYKMADVFTFASPDENLPMVVIEAMAAGLPIVALDVDWARDVITNGYDGILTEEIAQGYAGAISEILNNTEKREEIQRNQLITAAKYSLEKMAETMFGLYEDIIEQRKNQP